MAGAIEFWFDVISPYAYLAWTQIHVLAQRHDRSVLYRPVLFAALLNHWGQLGPAEVEPKRIHAFKQVIRRANRLGVPIALPFAHPFNPLTPLRVTALDLPASEQRQVIDAIFRAIWVEARDVTQAQSLVSALDSHGMDGQALVSASMLADNKARLLANKDEAIARGFFGVPTVVVDGEVFFGADDLPFVDEFLAGRESLTPEMMHAIEQLPISAMRPGSRRGEARS
jgi:2-hydroxychromene-2-carboxylate isomerase